MQRRYGLTNVVQAMSDSALSKPESQFGLFALAQVGGENYLICFGRFKNKLK